MYNCRKVGCDTEHSCVSIIFAKMMRFSRQPDCDACGEQPSRFLRPKDEILKCDVNFRIHIGTVAMNPLAVG